MLAPRTPTSLFKFRFPSMYLNKFRLYYINVFDYITSHSDATISSHVAALEYSPPTRVRNFGAEYRYVLSRKGKIKYVLPNILRRRMAPGPNYVYDTARRFFIYSFLHQKYPNTLACDWLTGDCELPCPSNEKSQIFSRMEDFVLDF